MGSSLFCKYSTFNVTRFRARNEFLYQVFEGMFLKVLEARFIKSTRHLSTSHDEREAAAARRDGL